jgi:hypothetical protein
METKWRLVEDALCDASELVGVRVPKVVVGELQAETWTTDVDGDLLRADEAHVFELGFRAGERRFACDSDVLAPLADVVEERLVFRRDEEADGHFVEPVAVTTSGFERGEDAVEVVFRLGADFLAERLADARDRGRTKREVACVVPEVRVRAVRGVHEVVVVGGQTANAVARRDECDDDILGDEERTPLRRR